MTNFIVDDFNGPVAYAVYPSWGTLENETLAASPDLVLIGPVFGVIPRAETSSTAPPMPANDDKYRFTFEGLTYRLSGLVVQGELGSATLIGQEGEAVRVAAGDAMPSGEQIVSISLNELVLLREDGSSETVVIYNR